jgi:hypothetical protein
MKSNDRLIRLPLIDTKQNYLSGFWRWVGLIEAGDYQAAIDALYPPHGEGLTAEGLRKNITTFFGGELPWLVVTPNERLVRLVEELAEFQPRTGNRPGWFMATVPVTTHAADAKSDDIPLMGIASSFFVLHRESTLVMQFEIFHV